MASTGSKAPTGSTAGMPSAATGTPAHRADPAGAWFGGGLPDGPAPAPPGGTPRNEAPPYGAPHDEAPSGDVDGVPRASQGRAARRRQLARWKKSKRRAAVATAVALVGGGLTLAALDRQSPDRAQAASAPDNRPMGATDGQTSAEDRPEQAAPGTHRSARTTAPAHARRAVSDAPRGYTLAASPRTSAPDTRTDSAAAPEPAGTPAAQQHAAAPTSGGTGTTAGQQPPAPASTPAPAHTSTSTGGGTGTTGGSTGSTGGSTGSTGGSTGSGTSPASPSPAATSPSQLCLLVVCIG
ncbi:hypothetical protein AB0E10_44555 [Streptomyces sp. NPDC048045]|uniref:SCO2400 family protein n=1 Tax=Streptomyces sp. NPDC048045 TaxID=3154710 RepID=UPI00341D54FD